MRQDLLLRQLADITGKENLFTSQAEILPYALWPSFTDIQIPEKIPLAVVRPRHLGHLASLVKFCQQEGLPMGICGGNTALIPKKLPSEGIIILTAGLNRIHEIDVINRTALVEAGVVAAALEDAAGEKGLFLPSLPTSSRVCTIGGILATNASGTSVIKYGPIASYVQSMQVMTVRGEILNCGGQNCLPGQIESAYPLANLFCGAMDTLGIICGATLRLVPKPQARRYCVAGFQSNAEAARAAAAIIEAMITPAAMDFLDRECAATINGNWNCPVLLPVLEGHAGQVAEEEETCRAILQNTGAKVLREFDAMPPADLGRVQIASRLHGTFGDFLHTAVSCPLSRLAALMEGITEIGERRGVPIALYGDAGVARIYAAVFINDRPKAASDAARDIFTLELVLNGRMKSEKDSAASKQEWNKNHRELVDYSIAIKQVFDPGNLFAAPGALDDMEFIGKTGQL